MFYDILIGITRKKIVYLWSNQFEKHRDKVFSFYRALQNPYYAWRNETQKNISKMGCVIISRDPSVLGNNLRNTAHLPDLAHTPLSKSILESHFQDSQNQVTV